MFINKFNRFSLLFSTLLLITCSLAFNSCGNDDEEPQTPPASGQSLTAPTGFTARASGSQVLLSWNSVEGADSYSIYRASSANGQQYNYSWGDHISGTSAIDPNPLSGDNYYEIRAEIKIGDKRYTVSSPATTVVNFNPAPDNPGNNNDENTGGNEPNPDKPSKPTGVKAVQNGKSIDVSWNPSSKASHYEVHFTKPNSGTFLDFIYGTSVSYKFDNMVDGTYTFCVYAVSSNNVYSDPSETVSCYYSGSGGGNTGGGNTGNDNPGNNGNDNTGGGNSGNNTSKLETPTGLTVNSLPSDSFVQLQCNAVPLGYDYQLYRSTNPNSGYTKINASVGSNTNNTIIYFTDSNPKSGTTYYKVKVSALPSLGIKESDFSDYVKVVR